MPTARIFTNIDDIEDRRLLAKAGTEVFSSLGLRPEHITTAFTSMSGMDLFVADRTFEETYGGDKFVLISVCLGSKRGAEVRARLAQAYTDAVAGVVARHNIAVDFAFRDAGDVYVGGVALGRATTGEVTARGGSGDRTSTADERLRRLLSKHWRVGSTDWEAGTPLSELRPSDVEWDSLEVASLAVVIEKNLGLIRDLDTGEEDVRKAFGDDAIYADLLRLVESCAG